MEDAIRRLARQMTIFGITDVDVNSDFGLAAERFRNEYLPSINHRTTIMILGDGRNNGKAPDTWAPEEIEAVEGPVLLASRTTDRTAHTCSL